jgi:uncharacterized protein YkwD
VRGRRTTFLEWVAIPLALGCALVACDQQTKEEAVILGGTSVAAPGGSSSSSAKNSESVSTTSSNVSNSEIEVPDGMARWEVQEEQSGIDPAHEAMNTINAVRMKAGLSPLVQNKLLSQAAQNHATFVTENFELYSEQGLSAYVEPANTPGATGETPMDRMSEAGYQGIYVAELIAFKHTPTASIYGWLDTLYQRVRILDSNVSEMGHGWGQVDDYTLHIVELGRHE